MFNVDPSELMLLALVALVVIGPKDLPKAMRFVGHWVAKARGVMGQFRAGFDTMVREAELKEMEQRWAAENERIMREHPAPAAPQMLPMPEIDGDFDPVMTEKPVMIATSPAPGPSRAPDQLTDDEIAAAEGVPIAAPPASSPASSPSGAAA